MLRQLFSTWAINAVASIGRTGRVRTPEKLGDDVAQIISVTRMVGCQIANVAVCVTDRKHTRNRRWKGGADFTFASDNFLSVWRVLSHKIGSGNYRREE